MCRRLGQRRHPEVVSVGRRNSDALEMHYWTNAELILGYSSRVAWRGVVAAGCGGNIAVSAAVLIAGAVLGERSFVGGAIRGCVGKACCADDGKEAFTERHLGMKEC